MKKFRVLLFFIILILAVHSFLFAQTEENEITLTVSFPPLKITPAGNYYSLSMEGSANYGAVGEPVIPVKTVKVLIPHGKTEGAVSVELGEKIIIGGSYLIEPGQEPVPLSYKGPVKITSPNSKIYTSNSAYPSGVFSEPVVQWKEGCRVLVINLYPASYIPSIREVSYYKSLTIHVPLTTTKTSFREYSMFKELTSKNDVRKFVSNPEAVETYPSRSLTRSDISPLSERGGADTQYVIITTDALKNASGTYTFQDLVADKQARGISAGIVTTEYIYANYSGLRPDGETDDQTKIRNFIIDAYHNWNTEYVLLGGDADGKNLGGESEDPIVPVRKLWARNFEYGEGDNIPADIYYSCLDGTFDTNGNGLYGECPADNPDFVAEVYVGRACVDSDTEVSNFVKKTLHYEATIDHYLLTACMVGEQLDYTPTWGGNYKDEVKNGSSAHGYTTIGFNADPSLTTSTLYDRDYPGHYWPKSVIIDIINDNVHLINHLGHGDNGGCMKINQTLYSDVANLVNTEFFIGYSQGCFVGAFDNWYSLYDYISRDCILEHFTTEAHGAVAFIGNSRYGLYSPGGTDGFSQRFDREFWDALFGENIFELGKMNSDSKEDNIGLITSDPYARYCVYEINLFGDPQLSVRLVTSKGMVWLDKDYYSAPATVYVTVWDNDLDTNPNSPDSTTVKFTSNIEPAGEVVTLAETGSSTGVFTGSIDLAVGGASPDEILQVHDGDTIAVTYIDANDGAGYLNVTVMDTAQIFTPLEAPTLNAEIGDGSVILQWLSIESPILAGYNIYRSNALDGNYIRLNALLIHEPPFEDVDISAGTTYYYYVAGEDIFNNETPSNIVELTTEVGTACLTMQVSPAGSGTTNPSEDTPHTYDTGTTVNMSASPNAGYTFSSWAGDVADPSSASTTVTMNDNKTITANFVINGVVTVCGDGVCNEGESCSSCPGDCGNCNNGGGGGGGGGGCFIATACYGTPMADEVILLKEFRDRDLLSNPVGKTFVRAYYKFSPSIADFINKTPLLKKIIRGILKPIVWVVRETR